MDLTEIECEGVDWINVAQRSDQWQGLVSFVMNIRSMQHVNFITEPRFPFQDGLCSMQLRVLQLFPG
jgi:hypothetical protein